MSTKNRTAGPFIGLDNISWYLCFCRFRRPLLRPAIDRTDQVDIPRYSVCLLTPNRLGDRAATSQHVGPDHSSPSERLSSQEAGGSNTSLPKYSFDLFFETFVLICHHRENPLTSDYFDEETLLCCHKMFQLHALPSSSILLNACYDMI